jgi:hypothetical protein
MKLMQTASPIPQVVSGGAACEINALVSAIQIQDKRVACADRCVASASRVPSQNAWSVVPAGAVKRARSLACVIEGSDAGLKLNVTVTGAASCTSGGPSAYAAPPAMPPPGTSACASDVIVIEVGDDSAPGGMATDDPSPTATVPPAGPTTIEAERVSGDVDPEP